MNDRWWTVAALLFLIGAVFTVGYSGRSSLYDSQIAACERGRLDRNANIQGWTQARIARLDTALNPEVDPAERKTALETAGVYDRIIASLESRTGPRLVCEDRVPKPSLFPF